MYMHSLLTVFPINIRTPHIIYPNNRTSNLPFHFDGVSQTHWYNKYGIVFFCDRRGHMSKFLNYDVFMSVKVVFILANSEDTDEMRPYAAFHLCLHCLPKYLFTDIKYEKGSLDFPDGSQFDYLMKCQYQM